jgi:hypothetical protein
LVSADRRNFAGSRVFRLRNFAQSSTTHDKQGTAGMFEVALFVIGGSAIGAAIAFLMGA